MTTKLLLTLLLQVTSIFCFAQINNYTLQRYDVVIDEIMPNPSPPVGLPNAAYIEIKNLSGKTVNLAGWKISSATHTSSGFPSFSLPPDSFLVLCAITHASLFSSFGKVLGLTGFPSLNNEGTTLTLTTKEGIVMHAVAYHKNWYQNAVKSGGGWSLEMIDTHNPCEGGSNWKACVHANGGTPGKKNSVDGVNNDQTPPQLTRTYSMDSVTLVALFNEPVDSSSGAATGNYTLSNGIAIRSATPQRPLFNEVVLKLNAPLQRTTVYHLTVLNVKDCRGNAIGAFNKALAGLSEEALPSDLVINELLFNPRPNAFDYVEVYNKSNKILNANKLYLARRSNTGTISASHVFSKTPFQIFPGDYTVLTADAISLPHEYFVKNPGWVLTLPSMPSFPNDKGHVLLLNGLGAPIDEVAYSDKWHFALIANSEGVALERIDPSGISQDRGNWHSAASTAGYGTPTYKNSQYRQTEINNVRIEISPKIFSPDNDGKDDVTTIQYNVEASGYVANLTIFDAAGRPIRYLVNNALLGIKGQWTWDGLDEKKEKLPIGTYIIYTELFNLEGKKKAFKNTVVLTRQLN